MSRESVVIMCDLTRSHRRSHTTAWESSTLGSLAPTGECRNQAKALLLQASGFEGLFGVEVGSNPNPLAVLELDHRAVRRFDLGLACRATPADDADPDRPVAKVQDLLVVGVKLREGLVQVSEPLANALVSPIHGPGASYRHQNRPMPLDLGVEFRQQRFGISAVDRVKRAFEGLDIRLRHRPCSIREFGGCRLPGAGAGLTELDNDRVLATASREKRRRAEPRERQVAGRAEAVLRGCAAGRGSTGGACRR